MKTFLPIFLLFSCGLSAQQRAVWFEHIGMESGLSHGYVTALCRDHRGFLWIGTGRGGLNRYDGCEMKVYRHDEGDSLSFCDDNIVSILEDSDGYIWVGTFSNGVCRLNPANGKSQNFNKQNGKLLGNGGNHLFKDGSGGIWTSNMNGVEYYDPKDQRFVPLPASKVVKVCDASDFDTSGILWGGGLGLTRIDLNTQGFQHYMPYPDTSDVFFGDINTSNVEGDRHGNIWVKTWGGGLLRFRPEYEQFERFLWIPESKAPNYQNIAFDIAETFDARGNRNFWVAAEHGLFKFPLGPKDFPALKKTHEFFDNQSGVGLDDYPKVLLADDEGNLWGGSEYTGLFRCNTRQENFQVIKKVKEGGIDHIEVAANGDIFVCGDGDPLAILDAGFGRKTVFHRFLPAMHPTEGRVCWAAVRDETSGIIYAATLDGLVAYDAQKGSMRWFQDNPSDSTGLYYRRITHVFPLGNDRLLLGLWSRPLQVFDASTGKNVKTFEGGVIVRHIRKTAEGNIWICAEGRLLIFDAQKIDITDYTPDPDRVYYDIYTDANGGTWLATDVGLYLFDVPSRRILAHYGTAEGLPNNVITSMCGDSLGRLWLRTSLGICHFDPATRQCHTLRAADGLVFGALPDWMGQMPDGRIWLSFNGGHLEIFKPERIKTPQPSRIYITGMKINERDTLPDVPFERIPEIRLRPGENDLTFTYTAIDLESPGKTNFLYRIDGLQQHWTRAGKTRMATFVNLPPGTYTFRVRPEDAGDSDAWDATLRVVVTDYFWQRAWFEILSVVVLTGLLFSLFFYGYTRHLRLRHLQVKSQLDLQEERNRISRDLHDDLGSGLGAIGLLSDIALSKTGSAEMRIEVGKIAESSRDLSAKIREIIWAASARNDTLEKLIGYLHQYAVSLFAGSDIELRAHLPADLPAATVPGERRRAVFLAFKEALNNIIRHANATRADLQFAYTDQQLTVRIGDNGRGFDPLTIDDSGNGLVNMRQRVEGAGGQFRLESGDNGTVVTFILPL